MWLLLITIVGFPFQSLGNHEFDEGVEGLVPFLEKVDFPVLASNLDLSKTPTMQNLPSLKASQVFVKGGR